MTPRSNHAERDELILRDYQLQALENAINDQTRVVKDMARDMGVDPVVLRDSQGNWPMIQCLQAQANTQLARVLLAKEIRRASHG